MRDRGRLVHGTVLSGKQAGRAREYTVSGSVLTDREPIRAGPVPLRIG
jgi:hypothetical protein